VVRCELLLRSVFGECMEKGLCFREGHCVLEDSPRGFVLSCCLIAACVFVQLERVEQNSFYALSFLLCGCLTLFLVYGRAYL
jgi:hypothetical protein